MKKQYIQPTMTCSEVALQSFITVSPGVHDEAEEGETEGGDALVRGENESSWGWNSPYNGEW